MKDKKIYCHTSYNDKPSFNTHKLIIKGNWYITDKIIGDYCVIKHSENYTSTILIDSFSDYFYTQEEYRDRKLNELLYE